MLNTALCASHVGLLWSTHRVDLTTVAVPHTLTHLKLLLPAAPARILEVGCGRGALAAELVDLGYEVTGVDRDAEAVKTATERGVVAIHGDVHDISGVYEVVLFTRSLHHAENLDGILEHAVHLLAAHGQIIIEEFAWSGSITLPQASCTTIARCWWPLDCSTPTTRPATFSTPGSLATTPCIKVLRCWPPWAASVPV